MATKTADVHVPHSGKSLFYFILNVAWLLPLYMISKMTIYAQTWDGMCEPN